MGIFSTEKENFLIEDFILVKQAVTHASVELDMTWWAEKQIELFEKRGIQPWQTSCWCHTHPEGINHPSGTDEETMRESFGNWNFVLMLILTKGGVFYARMDFDHAFAESGKNRFSAPCAVKVQWGMTGKSPVTEETIKAWEAEFRELVQEHSSGWLMDRLSPDADRPKRMPRLPDTPGKEDNDYARYCDSFGFDPNDPRIIEDYFGLVPEEAL